MISPINKTVQKSFKDGCNDQKECSKFCMKKDLLTEKDLNLGQGSINSSRCYKTMISILPDFGCE